MDMFKVGDLVDGITEREEYYSYTFKGGEYSVAWVEGERIGVRILKLPPCLERKDLIGKMYGVSAKHFTFLNTSLINE